MCKSLLYIKGNIANVKLSSWWHYAQCKPQDMYKCRVILRLLLDCHNLNTCQMRYKKKDIVTPACHLCNTGQAQNVSHVMFGCEAIQDLRLACWSKVQENLPRGLLQEINVMNNEQKAALLITGLNNSFTIEWLPLYDALANFIYVLYKQYV